MPAHNPLDSDGLAEAQIALANRISELEEVREALFSRPAASAKAYQALLEECIAGAAAVMKAARKVSEEIDVLVG